MSENFKILMNLRNGDTFGVVGHGSISSPTIVRNCGPNINTSLHRHAPNSMYLYSPLYGYQTVDSDYGYK